MKVVRECTVSADQRLVDPNLLPTDVDAHASIETARQETEDLVEQLAGDYAREVIDRPWQEEVVYFLLPDRFNAAKHQRADLELPAPPRAAPGDQTDTRWDFWAVSGRNRFQGGTIAGITEKLTAEPDGSPGYLPALGVTTLWVGPVWHQRVAGVDRNVSRRDTGT